MTSEEGGDSGIWAGLTEQQGHWVSSCWLMEERCRCAATHRLNVEVAGAVSSGYRYLDHLPSGGRGRGSNAKLCPPSHSSPGPGGEPHGDQLLTDREEGGGRGEEKVHLQQVGLLTVHLEKGGGAENEIWEQDPAHQVP